jgi:hypothetical protein
MPATRGIEYGVKATKVLLVLGAPCRTLVPAKLSDPDDEQALSVQLHLDRAGANLAEGDTSDRGK